MLTAFAPTVNYYGFSRPTDTAAGPFTAWLAIAFPSLCPCLVSILPVDDAKVRGVCIFFSIVYVNARDRKQDTALERTWFLGWLVGVPASMGVIVVYVFNEEYKAIRKGAAVTASKDGKVRANRF